MYGRAGSDLTRARVLIRGTRPPHESVPAFGRPPPSPIREHLPRDSLVWAWRGFFQDTASTNGALGAPDDALGGLVQADLMCRHLFLQVIASASRMSAWRKFAGYELGHKQISKGLAILLVGG
jgi:hypothetical protein